MFISAVNKLITDKDAIITAFEAAMKPTFDISGLEAKAAELQAEMLDASELMQNCIYENAHVALDQSEYQKRYDSLAARYETAKAQLETVTVTISDKQSRQATIKSFLATLKAQDGLVEKFDTDLWCGLVDFVTVYTRDDVRFTFKNGTEIQA